MHTLAFRLNLLAFFLYFRAVVSMIFLLSRSEHVRFGQRA